MSTASTEPENVIALIMAIPAVLDEPGGPKSAMLHSELEGIFISRFFIDTKYNTRSISPVSFWKDRSIKFMWFCITEKLN